MSERLLIVLLVIAAFAAGYWISYASYKPYADLSKIQREFIEQINAHGEEIKALKAGAPK